MYKSKRRTESASFTKAMKKSHTILIPSMLDFHFPLLKYAFTAGGYKAEYLMPEDFDKQEIIRFGWEFSNNDLCYPANLIIGQFISALKSGKYNPHKTALLLPQTGGGCRACNYIHILRKALDKAGFSYVPVISLNVSGVEKQEGFSINLKMILTACAAIYYSDLLMHLYHCISPYEKQKMSSKNTVDKWNLKLGKELSQFKGISPSEISENFNKICSSFKKIELCNREVKHIGITGELYIKFCRLGNENIEDFLRHQKCRIHMTGFVPYVMYLADCCTEEDRIYHKKTIVGQGAKTLISYMSYLQKLCNKSLRHYGFEEMTLYKNLKGYCNSNDFGKTMGDGWLIKAETADSLEHGCKACFLTVPFGCMVSHTCARGVINELRKKYPDRIICPIDYDSGSSAINQQNRIKMVIDFIK
ncbi:MAG: 2-hydroxyglutaryl-CoA dehydratase [Oscillospiraceae bacterium]